MANLTITAASVLPGANAKIAQGIAGATITAGQVLYLDPADNKLKLASAGAAATASPVGIALQGAANGQRVEYVYEDDDFTPGATLVLTAIGDKGTYVLSATAGAIAPLGDLIATNRLTGLLTAKSATKAILKITSSGAAIA